MNAMKLDAAVAAVEAIACEPLSETERDRLRKLVTAITNLLGEPRKPHLRVNDEVRWFELAGGERVSLQRRGPVRLLFKALIDQHRRLPGRATTLNELFEAGWPGQRTTHESGAARVYVALATLRRLGLRPLLQTRDDGYLIDPAAAIEVFSD